MFATKLERRISLFASWNWSGDNNTLSFREEIKKGKYPWIRTTGRPCNCRMCTSHKYQRPHISELRRKIYEELFITDVFAYSMYSFKQELPQNY